MCVFPQQWYQSRLILGPGDQRRVLKKLEIANGGSMWGSYVESHLSNVEVKHFCLIFSVIVFLFFF